MLSAEFPASNIVITKPVHAVEICDSLSKLQYLLVDEADLLFEFGYKKETMKFAEALRVKCTPKRFQAVLLSATMDKEVEELANMLLYKPEYIEVARDVDMGTIKEYYIEVPEDDRPLMLYTLIKMETLPSSRIIFVNSNQRGYFLYCLLRKLYIDSKVLSKLLSPKLRMSIIQSFNQGMIDTLIVVDTEETLSRGIDFKSVKCVINYDEPESLDSYIHRIGRGGRLTDSVAILMCKEAVSRTLDEGAGDSENPTYDSPMEAIFSERSLEKLGIEASSLVPLKYRIEDASKVVTPKLIEIAKMQAVRQSALHEDEFIAKVTSRDAQMLKEVLKTDNELLKADKKHLDYIPKYIMDEGLRKDVEGVRRITGAKKNDFVKKPEKPSKPKKTKKKFTKKKLPHFKRKKK
ncbi:DEAD box ATP-dependent RNA helicase family member protein [Theileria equi strain WA]|uniref:RNA helicase n=1 Tax=Theileria equi strain WA TaxID=1537102 RepID=L1LC26_THEEQ|nr:DEAD box ATP-dependent RNA helicase family member protein [Theileria equi strain WA]EKX72790.1 DEAD box ATP-dependent RNA helicase family member protein [Theileria equi strain WA]|eukprot:XP_004832242.1 DEAD box ATP-dependent RNA helicase family member protein [Theileria equi strain WA]